MSPPLVQYIVTAVRRAAGTRGAARALRRLRSGHLAIVMYHGVSAVPLPVYNWSQLDASTFEEHVAFLAQEYRVLPLREVIGRLTSGGSLPRRTAVITFDDAFRNVVTTAYPILAKYQVPATVFVVTSLPDSAQPAWSERVYSALAATDMPRVSWTGHVLPLTSPGERAAAHQTIMAGLKRLAPATRESILSDLWTQIGSPPTLGPESPLATMTWAEIAVLSNTGLIDFGSHTHTHPILSTCDAHEQEQELRRSRDILRDRLGRADLLAYPNGRRADFTSATQQLARALGYSCGLSTIPGLNTSRADAYALRRVNVGAGIQFQEFETAMAGL